MSEIIAAASGDGGSGKTMFAANLASVLAVNGYKVLLMDMNTGLRNLDMAFGMEKEIKYDISDVLSGACTLKKALVRSSEYRNLFLLEASQSGEKAAIHENDMKRLCRRLIKEFDYIIIDLPSGLGEDWKAAASQARKAIIMLTPEHSSVREAASAAAALRECSSAECFAVINKFKGEYYGNEKFPSVEDIVRTLDIPVIGGIADDELIHFGMNSGAPAAGADDNYIARNFKRIFLRMYERM